VPPALAVSRTLKELGNVGSSAHVSSELAKHATLEICPGGWPGLVDTNTGQLNTDLLAFIRTS
jgi:hypothetical protein